MDAPLAQLVGSVLAIFFFSTRILQARTSHLFALILSAIVCVFLIRQSSGLKQTYLADMERKYLAIGAPRHMHTDARLVQFFHWLLDWRDVNPDAYDNTVIAVDGLLRVEADVVIGSDHCANDYDVALGLYRSAMNHLHSFIFSLEHPMQVTRLRNALDELRKLLVTHLSVISTTCKGADGITVNTRYIDPLNQPAPYDDYKDEAWSRFAFY